MSRQARILSFGACGVLVCAGAVCAATLGGLGQIMALVLIGMGLVAATSLVFYEVGLSEDRERAREERARAAQAQSAAVRTSRDPTGRRLRPLPRLDRMRGRPRRLR